MYLVQTLGVINDSALVGSSFILSSSVILTSNKFQGRRCFWNVICPINSLYHLNVDSSFIHAFEELATEHYHLYSSSSEFDSLLAAANTKYSSTLVNVVYPPNEQTHKRFHVWWVSLEHPYHWKFNSSFRYHIVSENSFLYCRKILRSKIILTL